jgi:hypothetical protein
MRHGRRLLKTLAILAPLSLILASCATQPSYAYADNWCTSYYDPGCAYGYGYPYYAYPYPYPYGGFFFFDDHHRRFFDHRFYNRFGYSHFPGHFHGPYGPGHFPGRPYGPGHFNPGFNHGGFGHPGGFGHGGPGFMRGGGGGHR